MRKTVVSMIILGLALTLAGCRKDDRAIGAAGAAGTAGVVVHGSVAR